MKKLTQTAKRLDIFFRIFQIASNIAWVGSLVGVGIAALGVCFRLDPNMVGTGYNSLELGFAELEVAADFAPDERMVLIQVGVVLALCAVFMLVAWKGCKEIRKILLRLARAILTRLGHQSRSTASTQLTLTSTHTYACTATKVNEVMYIQLIQSILNLTYRYLLALANQRTLLGIGYIYSLS